VVCLLALLEGGRSAWGGVASSQFHDRSRIALVCDPNGTEIEMQ